MAKKGIEITITSPLGGSAPIDPDSIEITKNDASAVSFLQEKKAQYENTYKIADFLGKTDKFDALFYPGGAGPMWDLATDADSQKLIAEFIAAGKTVAAVCHGPVAFQGVVLPDGKYLVDGKTVTSLCDEEEDFFGWKPYVPFSMEHRFPERGAKYVKASEIHGEKVVVDGNLITGQNLTSAKAVGEAIVQALRL